jgi:hypothetical protein
MLSYIQCIHTENGGRVKGLKFFGYAVLATCAGLVFLAALGWNAEALNQPLADASLMGIFAALFIWLVRVGSFGWTIIGALMAFGSLSEIDENANGKGSDVTPSAPLPSDALDCGRRGH